MASADDILKVEAKKTRKLPRIGTKMSLFVLAATMISSCSIAAASIFVFTQRSVSAKSSYALTFAKSIAESINPSRLSDLLENGEKDEYLVGLIDTFNSSIRASEINRLYIIAPGEGGFSTITDTRFENGFMSVATDAQYYFDSEKVFSDGQDTVSSIYNSGASLLITGFAMIRDEAMNPIAMVGADASIGSIAEDAWKLIFIEGCLVAGLCLIFSWLAALFTNANVGRPIMAIASDLEKLASGNIELEELVGQSSRELDLLAKIESKASFAVLDFLLAIEQTSRDIKLHPRLEAYSFSGGYGLAADKINRFLNDSEAAISVINAFGSGEFDAELPLNSSGRAESAVDGLRKNLTNILYQASLMTSCAKGGNLKAGIDARQFEGDWKLLAQHLNEMVNAIIEPEKDPVLLLSEMNEENREEFDSIIDSFSELSKEASAFHERAAEIPNSESAVAMECIEKFSEIAESTTNLMARLNEMIIRLLSNAVVQSESSGGERKFEPEATTAPARHNGRERILKEIEEKAENETLGDQLNADLEKLVEGGLSEQESPQDFIESMEIMKKSSSSLLHLVKAIEDMAGEALTLSKTASEKASHAGEMSMSFAEIADLAKAMERYAKNAVISVADTVNETMVSANIEANAAQASAGILQASIEGISEAAAFLESFADSSVVCAGAMGEIKRYLNQISQLERKNLDVFRQCLRISGELSSRVAELKRMNEDIIAAPDFEAFMSGEELRAEAL
ncbi:MAG: hypothetical protein LBU32_02635 [Clostridiales bacterium]|nr:hypothetical protein [Clostridiales bacterium]